jgi:hypothetical protein
LSPLIQIIYLRTLKTCSGFSKKTYDCDLLISEHKLNDDFKTVTVLYDASRPLRAMSALK